MDYEEIIHIEDYDEFKKAVTTLSANQMYDAVQARWDYLYEKYRPNENHIKSRKAMK